MWPPIRGAAETSSVPAASRGPRRACRAAARVGRAGRRGERGGVANGEFGDAAAQRDEGVLVELEIGLECLLGVGEVVGVGVVVQLHGDTVVAKQPSSSVVERDFLRLFVAAACQVDRVGCHPPPFRAAKVRCQGKAM